jgi:hypothetical protein
MRVAALELGGYAGTPTASLLDLRHTPSAISLLLTQNERRRRRWDFGWLSGGDEGAPGPACACRTAAGHLMPIYLHHISCV